MGEKLGGTKIVDPECSGRQCQRNILTYESSNRGLENILNEDLRNFYGSVNIGTEVVSGGTGIMQ
jgi:hypothetical protein